MWGVRVALILVALFAAACAWFGIALTDIFDVVDILPFLNLAFALFTLAAPVIVGGYALFFSRRFSIRALQFHKRVWNRNYTEPEIRLGQRFAIVIGSFLFVGGIFNPANWLL